jgi:hypothetical protein
MAGVPLMKASCVPDRTAAPNMKATRDTHRNCWLHSGPHSAYPLPAQKTSAWKRKYSLHSAVRLALPKPPTLNMEVGSPSETSLLTFQPTADRKLTDITFWLHFVMRTDTEAAFKSQW